MNALKNNGFETANTWSRKVGFYYHMKKGDNDVGEQYCELPVSAERYAELINDAETEGTEAYKDVFSALEILTKLQGYDRLLGFKLEKIQ